MRGAVTVASLALCAALGGCHPADTDPPEALEIRAFRYEPPELDVAPLSDGDSVELWHAPQGGFVLPIGARVRGLDSSNIEIRARLSDTETQDVFGEHVRIALMASLPDEPGWVENDRRSITQFAHIPLCPSPLAVDPLVSERQLSVSVLELHADDSEGHTEVRVALRCPEDPPEVALACARECAPEPATE
jgi:hypothetical protein